MCQQHAHHAHPPISYNLIFAIGVGLNLIYVVIEAGVGFWVQSMSLLADAGHNLSDIIGLLLAWGGYALSRLPATQRYTYGFRSGSILAALLNGVILVIVLGYLGWESLRRLADPVEVPGMTVIVVATIGVIVNGVTTLMFVRGRHDDVNIRGAFLHMAADTGISLAVALGGVAILLTGAGWVDPALSLLVVILVLVGTWGLLKESIDLLLQAVPQRIDPAAVENYLAQQPGVARVEQMHIWAMSTTEVALTAHLVRPGATLDDAFLEELAAGLRERFRIVHTTIQLKHGPPPEDALDEPASQSRPHEKRAVTGSTPAVSSAAS